MLAALAVDLQLVETDAKHRGDRLADLGHSLAAGEADAEPAGHPALWRKIVGDIIKETAAMRAAASGWKAGSSSMPARSPSYGRSWMKRVATASSIR